MESGPLRSKAHYLHLRRVSLALGAAMLLVALPVSLGADGKRGGVSWSSSGGDAHNTRSQEHERIINPRSAVDLRVAWSFDTGGDVSATPAVDRSSVYVPDWAGNLFSINRRTGVANWSRPISDYTGVPGDRARTTPAIHGNKLILGNQQGFLGQGSGAWVFAVDKKTGDRVWATKVEDHAASIITQSAVVHRDRVYVGVSSMEEAFAGLIPGYTCCSFRGSVIALDARTGKVLWKTYMVPELPGYSGNAVWGSSPVVDVKRGSLFVTTGNNYTVSNEVLLCVGAALQSDPNDEDAVRACVDEDEDNYFDALVALDLRTGSVKWAKRVVPFDAWTVACIVGFVNPDNCPSPAGPDHDFAQGPSLFTVRVHEGSRDSGRHHGDKGHKSHKSSKGHKGKGHKEAKRELLGAGQKSGVYWAVDPDDGELVWSTQVGPGGELGGLQWGSAVDGSRIYTAVSNSNFAPWELVRDGVGTGELVHAGLWSALDAATGKILWQTADPNGAMDSGAVTVANGVLFAGSLAADPTSETMFALDAETGEILWGFPSGATVNSGAAVVDGHVFWGSGYANLGLGTPNDKLFAFTVR